MFMYTMIVLLTFSCQYSMSSHRDIQHMPINPTHAELWGRVGDPLSDNLYEENSFAFILNPQSPNDEIIQASFLLYSQMTPTDNQKAKKPFKDIDISSEEKIELNNSSPETNQLKMINWISNKYLDPNTKDKVFPTRVRFKKNLKTEILNVDWYQNENYIGSTNVSKGCNINSIMDVKSPNDFTKDIGPINIFNNVTEVTYHNGWYEEQVLRYDGENKPTIYWTWQHKKYIFCTTSEIILFLYATYFLLHKHS